MTMTMMRVSATRVAFGAVLRGSRAASSSSTTTVQPERSTALNAFHRKHGGRMVEFGGWNMPVTYSDQTLVQSHLWTRSKCSIFDVGHMLQTRWVGRDVPAFLRRITVADPDSLANTQATLSLFTNAKGGIIDDTVITRESESSFYIVSNAGCRDKDLAHFNTQLAEFRRLNPTADVSYTILDRSLLAIQGPMAAVAVEKALDISLTKLPFMHATRATLDGNELYVSRCGYTGEDGFEISLPHNVAVQFAERLLTNPDVKLAGLGPRDSLRLEAGLCLYGHDLNEEISPVEGSLTWTIAKSRRSQIGVENGGFLGSDKILPQIKGGVEKRRIGITFPKGSPPAREGTLLFDAQNPPSEIGVITSGSPSPSLGINIAMGYIKSGFHKSGTQIIAKVRNKDVPGTISKMPFVPSNYYKPT